MRRWPCTCSNSRTQHCKVNRTVIGVECNQYIMEDISALQSGYILSVDENVINARTRSAA